MSKKLYMIEGISTFHMRYLIEADSKKEAKEIVQGSDPDETINEFSQHHLGEQFICVRKIEEKDAIKEFRSDNEYLAHFSDERIKRMMTGNRKRDLFGEL